jgi:DNA-binding MarR family transcriptional regulator
MNITASLITTLKEKKAEYIIAISAALLALLCGVIWREWLYGLLARTSAVIPKQVLGAIIIILVGLSLASTFLAIHYYRRMKQVQRTLGEAEKQMDSLKVRAGELGSQLQDAEHDNRLLKNKLQEHTFNLDATAVKTLSYLAQAQHETYLQFIASHLQLHPTRVRYYLEELIKQDYIYTARPRASRPIVYLLTQKGREFLLKNDLI